MPRKRKLSNLADRCRFCLARDACMSELFADWLRPKLEDLQNLTGLEILDKANYPRKICYVCLYKLEMWNEFKGQFLKTNKTLITHFKIVEETLPEVNKSLDTAQDTADDLLSDDNMKRPKIDSTNGNTADEIIKSLLKTPEKVKSVRIDNISIDVTDFEENAVSSAGKSQFSDNSASNHRRGRSKRIEREASTKRWEERKNALIAATGEVPSESESDNGSQLSPVQKARVKARNIEIEFEKQKKLQKALKNLQTDLTEKYKISYEDIVITNERKTRSRQDSTANSERRTRSQQESKPNTEEICPVENVKVNLLKSPLAEKKLEMLNAVKKEKDKVEDKVEEEKEEKKLRKKREGKTVEMIELDEDMIIDITEDVNDQSNEIRVMGNKSNKRPEAEVVKESVNKPEIESNTSVNCENLQKELKPVKKMKKVVANKKAENDIDVIDLDDMEDTVNTSISQNQEIAIPFNPQELKSEVTLGNATYVVTTILDLPGSIPETKSDVSLKTNGLNIDTTSQEGNKIDIMNAVQLQQVKPKKDPKQENKTEQDIHQCLKIEIEGMEAQALQRVQLDLAHFVTDEIQQIFTEDESVQSKTNKLSKHKDSYETLNHQLKAIVKKVLRSNFETDKLIASAPTSLRTFTPEFLEAAKYSPIFQPQVVLQRLNLGQLCKTYNINNLHVLEDAKRQRGVVGPLSRTLGKRRPVLPKRYEDFALSVADEIKLREEESKLKVTKVSSSTSVTNATTSSKPMVAIPVTVVANSTTLSTPVTKAVAATKTNVSTSKPTPVANKLIPIASKTTTVVLGNPTANATPKTPVLSANKTTVTVTKTSTPVVCKSNVAATNVMTTTIPNKSRLVLPTIAKIRSEVPPKANSDSLSTVNSLVMDWSDSDHSVNEAPKELSTPPFKHLQLPKTTQLKELPLANKSNAPNSPAPTATPRSSMIVTKTGVSKASVQSAVQVASTTSPSAIKAVQSQQKVTKPTTISVASPASQQYRHLCGLCNKELFSEQEAEAHVKSHKMLANQQNASPGAAAPKATPGAPAPSKPAVGTSAPSKPPPATPVTSKPAVGKPAVGTPMQKKPAVGTPMQKKPAVGTPMQKKPAVGTPVQNKPAVGTPGASKPASQGQTPKPKLMRCKRCQAIVEAEQVKSHVCNSIKFNCTICECRFGAKHLLDTHIESTHQDQSTATAQPKQAKSSPAKEKQRVILIQEANDSKNSQSEENLEKLLTDKNAPRSEGYSCFVCDKVFDDELQMKEHLYMHSDEVSDDGDDKGFPCAFCYEKFQTEESLEAHVDNHLKDDGDEKINMLINLNTSRRERKRALFRCEVCSEYFTSAMLLAMHMQQHEDEEAELQAQEDAESAAAAAQAAVVEAAAAAAQQLQHDEPEPFVCTICDQIFETTDELTEHLDMHNGNAHVCILCEKPFSSIRDLQEHVSTHL